MLSQIAYYFFYACMWLFSLLPWRILYLISDILFYFFYYITPYRKKVVFQNLKNSFPEKSEKEINLIAKKFYHHLADLTVEIIKLTTLSQNTMLQRVQLLNFKIVDDLYARNRSIAGVLGHYGNWEWTNILSYRIPHKSFTIYKPLNYKFVDRFMNKMRGKFGIEPVAMGKIFRRLVEERNNNQLTATGFIADQRPMPKEIQYWATFLGQDTPVFMGIEKTAIKLDMAIVYFKMQKIKRGFYTIEPILLLENCQGKSSAEITDLHVKALEETIREKPEYWLWTHRRWKHKKELLVK